MSDTGSKGQEELIGRGFEVTREAVTKEDPRHLKKCIDKLLKIGAPIDGISAAIADCPIGLFEHTGFSVGIFSQALNRRIVLGCDVSWGNIRKLCLMDPRPAGGDLALIIEALSVFGGTIVDSGEGGSSEEQGQAGRDTQSALYQS